LVQRVTTPRIVYSRRYVACGELFSKTLKDFSFLSRDNEAKKNYPCRILLIKDVLKEKKIWVSYGSVFDSPLSVTAGS
jgi:hypothetical protein